ncbi:MAG TPA: TolC family protein [Gemmatimonadaceae bacterium]|nr:TolC family protein [Gemmatimonadaceae bacterium]
MSALSRLGTLFAAALLPAVAAAQGAAEAPRPISLDEAVRLAQQNAPALVQARGAMRSNAALVRRSYAAFLPSVNLSAGSSRSAGVSEVAGQLVPRRGEPWSFSNGISASLELFDGGQRFAELDRTRATVDAAAATETTQRFAVALNVKRQYYAVLAAREAESAARQQLEQAEQQLAAAAARLRAGSATKSDSLRTAIQVGNAQLAVLTAQNNINNGNVALTRLVGTSYPVTAAVPEDEPAAAPPLDSAALANLVFDVPAVRQAQANLVAAKASVRSARTAYLPSLSMSYSYRANQSSDGFETGNLWLLTGQNPNSRSLSFNFSYPLFNQLQRETSVTQAEVQERNAEAQLRDARLAAQEELAQALGDLRLAQERIRIQQQAVVSGEEDLRVQTARYELGAATLLDVLTSQTTLNQARLALIQARFDARIARAQIEALIGREL